MDLFCNMCSGTFYETSKSFDPNIIPAGHMFHFKEAYGPNGANWSGFMPGDEFDQLECPECGAPYTSTSGQIKPGLLIGTEADETFQCDQCPKMCTSEKALEAHRAQKHAPGKKGVEVGRGVADARTKKKGKAVKIHNKCKKCGGTIYGKLCQRCGEPWKK